MSQIEFWIDLVYKVLSLLLASGMLFGISRLVIWGIRIEPRIKSLEKQAENSGRMIQEFTASEARIEGILQGYFEYDGGKGGKKDG